MRQILFSLIIAALLLVTTSCTGGGNAFSTGTDESEMTLGTSSQEGQNQTHFWWGLWQFVADPEAKTLDVVHLRSGDFHLNALLFLEPPPLVFLTLESLQFNGNIVEADIGLRHPFLGLTEFTGFDVCGVLITNGSITGFDDPDLRMAGEGDTRLLNPDGYSRWWNTAEFPVNNGTMFSYKDGLLGAADSFANYNSTLNAYKYFCDYLDPNDPLDDVTLDKRGMFSAGQKNIRHYTIEMGDSGLIFNYAVDACWHFPAGGKPWVVPDDFPPDANRSEAWRVKVTETENTLWNDGTDYGGDLKLQVDVYDWFNAGLNTVRVESPGNFDMVESPTPTGGGPGYSTYGIDITDATPAAGQIELLVSVVSEKADFEGFIPGTNITAYFTHSAPVAEEPPTQPSPCKNIPLRDGVVPIDIALDHTNADLLVLYDDKTIYKYHKADCYKTGTLFISVTQYLPQTMIAIDMSANRYIALALTYVTPDTPGIWVYDPDGYFITGIGQGPPAPLEAFAMTGGSYANDLGYIRGYNNYISGYPVTVAFRLDDAFWYPPPYNHDFTISDGNNYGIEKVYYGFIKGSESDLTGNYMWFLEDPDYYASRWALTKDPVYEIYYLEYNSAYFGTGSQTDDDDGWNDGKDITRDNLNRYFVLDELSTGEPRVKVWTVNGNLTTSIGGFGDSTAINGIPRRIEGSDFDGDIVVLHGDTPPYMVSVFNPSEMPD